MNVKNILFAMEKSAAHIAAVEDERDDVGGSIKNDYQIAYALIVTAESMLTSAARLLGYRH